MRGEEKRREGKESKQRRGRQCQSGCVQFDGGHHIVDSTLSVSSLLSATTGTPGFSLVYNCDTLVWRQQVEHVHALATEGRMHATSGLDVNVARLVIITAVARTEDIHDEGHNLLLARDEPDPEAGLLKPSGGNGSSSDE